MSNTTLTVQTVTITPEHAARLLTKNTNNRNIRRSLVERLKLSMERDEWDLNGEAIKIGTDGRILDGQHRLTACVESGSPFTTLLMTGLAPETQYTMDTGIARSLGNMLELKGEKNVNGLASLIAGLIRTDKWNIKVGATQAGQGYPITIKEGLDYLDLNPWVRDLERYAYSVRTRTGLTSKIAGILAHTFSQIDHEDSAYFFDRLADGSNLDASSPILTLRNWLIKLRGGMEGGASAGNRSHINLLMAAYTIKAWNAFRDGVPLKQLKFRVGGANPETFPEPR